MSDALFNFIQNGNPNRSSLPNWGNFTIENGETIILKDVSEVKNDPDRAARELF